MGSIYEGGIPLTQKRLALVGIILALLVLIPVPATFPPPSSIPTDFFYFPAACDKIYTSPCVY